MLTRQVLEFVREEGLNPGDRLPSVQALAGRFSVSAPTMRESLRRLQAIGLVEIRHGAGVYMRKQTTPLVLPNPHPGQLSRPAVLDLLDARLLIEPTLAERAAERVTGSEVADLIRSLEEASAHLQGEDKLLGRLNLDFHRKVARISGNAVLAQIIDSLVEVYEDEQLIVMKLYDNRTQDHQEHLGILQSIASRSPELAGRRMRDHLQGVRTVLAERLLEDGAPDGLLAVAQQSSDKSRTSRSSSRSTGRSARGPTERRGHI